MPSMNLCGKCYLLLLISNCFWGFRFQGEWLLQRDLTLRACMDDCVPKEKSLIYHSSRVMLMVYPQVSFHRAYLYHEWLVALVYTAANIFDSYLTKFNLDSYALYKFQRLDKSLFCIFSFLFVRVIHNKCGCCCTNVVLQKGPRHSKNSKKMMSFLLYSF